MLPRSRGWRICLLVAGLIGLEPGEVAPASGATLSFRIGHGCEGQPTTSVSIQIPAGVASVSPFPKAGWDLDVERGPLAEPIAVDDQQITEGVVRVTWSGGSLEDGHVDEFRIRATVYGDEGDMIHFPVVQQCGELEHAWIEIPAEGQDGHDLDEPAPSLAIADGEDEGSLSPFTVLALSFSVTAIALSAAALATRRGSEAGEED